MYGTIEINYILAIIFHSIVLAIVYYILLSISMTQVLFKKTHILGRYNITMVNAYLKSTEELFRASIRHSFKSKKDKVFIASALLKKHYVPQFFMYDMSFRTDLILLNKIYIDEYITQSKYNKNLKKALKEEVFNVVTVVAPLLLLSITLVPYTGNPNSLLYISLFIILFIVFFSVTYLLDIKALSYFKKIMIIRKATKLTFIPNSHQLMAELLSQLKLINIYDKLVIQENIELFENDLEDYCQLMIMEEKLGIFKDKKSEIALESIHETISLIKQKKEDNKNILSEEQLLAKVEAENFEKEYNDYKFK